MKKRALALLLCLVMLFSGAPLVPLGEYSEFALSAFAAQEGLRVTFPNTTVFENGEAVIVPVATFDGETLEEGVTYEWESSDTSIATVDENGTVKGVSAGSGEAYADITVYASYSLLGENHTFVYTRAIKVVRFVEVDDLETEMNSAITMLEKEEKKFSVLVFPTSATTKQLKWTSSDESIIKVKSDGVDSLRSEAYANVTAVGEGVATLTYTTTDGTEKSGSFTVTVKPLIKTLTLPAFVVISTNATSYVINYEIYPANAGKQVLEWSSDNESICTVDALGVIRPGSSRAGGVCFVTAKTTDGSRITTKTKVVVSDGTKSLSLDKSSLTMKVGDEDIDLTASCVLNCGIPYTDAVNWSSTNTAVATVDMNGIVKAVGPGEAKIIAETADGSGLKQECSVSVTQPVKGIELPENETCWLNETKALTPVFLPANASDKGVVWTSSDESVATVSDTGVVTGLKEGYTTITVKTNDGGYEAHCRVSVEIPPLSLSLSDTAIKLKVGSENNSSYTLTAVITPNTVTNKAVTWSSSDTEVATVDKNGTVTAVAGGDAIIICTTKSGGKTAMCVVTVEEEATSVKIANPPASNLYTTGNYALIVRFNSPTVTNKSVQWSSSNPGIIEVDKNGLLTARGKGSSVITVTYERSDGQVLTDQCTVFVEERIAVEGVTLNESKKTIYTKVGSNVFLYETITPENASNKNVSWKSSNSGVASVYSGTVTTYVPGKVKIEVTTRDGGKTDWCEIYAVAPIEMYSSSAKVGINTSTKLSLVSDNPSDLPVVWESSDNSVATVNSNGTVTGIKEGSVIITATTPNNLYSTSCKVSVVVPVKGIKINADTVTVPKGETRSVSFTITPSNATDQNVTWSVPSSAFPIIEVSPTGVIEGKRTGNTYLTVTTNDGRYTDTIDVIVIQPVTGISFGYSSITLDAGKKKTITPQITPISATDKSVKWSTANKNIATVDKNGVVTAVSAGVTTITCSSADGFASETVKVTVTQPPTGIKFNAKSVTVKIGTPRKLNPKVTPDNASNKNIIYKSSDEKIAKVSPDGTVTGVAKGKVKITVTTANNLYSDTITVNVERAVKSVSLNKTSVTIAVGKTTTITATVKPKSASDKTVTWKSGDNDVVSVKNGKLTAKAPGYAVITCTSADGGKTAECTVFVNQPVKSVKLSKTSVILDVNDKLTLKGTVKPSNASNKALRWTSSKKSVVKVTSRGVLQPVSTGTATITVTSVDGGFKASCTVTVVKRVKSVSLPSALTVFMGEKGTLKAVLNPKKPSNPDIKWTSSKKGVATVKNGKITPKKVGTTVITVTTDDGGLKAKCKVSVKKALKSFTLNKKKVSLKTGGTFTLKVNRKPTNSTETVFFTSSNKSVATVSSKGVITATGRGTATITAKSERGITVSCKVTVSQPVNSMYISRNSAYVYLGETLKLTANVLPKNANNQSFTWSSSDNSVVTVNGGVITPKKLGTATITVRSANGKTAYCTVSVRQHVTAIALDKANVSLETAQRASLGVTVSPANATEKGYTFSSSDTTVATVSSDGVITAIAPGKATITVHSKENGKSASCAVTVIQRVRTVEISTEAETLYVDRFSVGETLSLYATVLPENATDKTVIWSSTDESVATVDENGNVTALKAGLADIIATSLDGGITAKCSITVLQHVSGITLEKSEVTVNKGQQIRLNATVEPADAYVKNIEWVHENEQIATMDQYGMLTGVGIGTTTVRAIVRDVRAGTEFKASCFVTVNEPVTGVSLDIIEVSSLYRDETVVLTPTVYPDFINDYINKAVTWSSSDESIATVDENGKVTAVGAGEVTITVTTVDGGFTDSCKINCFIPVEGISTEDIYFVKEGDEYTVEAVALPENASFPELSWEIVSGEEYFTCDNGLIKGIAKGNGLVRITSVDNPEITKEIEIRIVKRVESVALDKTQVTLNNGEASTLVPTVSPSDAHNKKVTFRSSDESVVTVDENGVVTAVGRGTATITVTTEDEGCTAECIFTVNQLVEEIVFAEGEYVVGAGKSISLPVNVLPENANDKSLDWSSSNPSVATVANGIVTGISVGEATVTATATDTGEISSSVKVTVVKHAEEIVLTAESDSLWVGDSTILTATVLPEDTTDKTVTFTSLNEEIATVDENGVVRAISAGETGTAEVTINAVSACASAQGQYKFTVRQQVTSIEVPDQEITLELGEGYTFAPVVLPENAFDKTVTYASSDENVLTVENGTVTTTGTGTATVTLRSACGKVEKTVSIKVIVLPEAIELQKELSVERGSTYQLSPVLLPANVTQRNITYVSYNEDVATVDENGIVTAHKAGNAVITAQTEKQGVFAECEITVYVSSEKIELTQESAELYIGEELTLGATVLPEDTTDKTVTYLSSDESVLSVDQSGKVTALSKGTAKVIVRAEDTGITSECTVKVKKHVEGITPLKDAVAYLGRTIRLQAQALPADADNQNIIWKTSDTRVAEIDENGVLTAHEKGFVIVTAETEDMGFKAICLVEILIGIDSLSLNKDKLILDRGASESLSFSVVPENADSRKVIWTSSDESIATVDENGKVTATQKFGTATIRATATDNPEAYAECSVTVKIPLETIYLQNKEIKLRKGETSLLKVLYRPADATIKDVTFESDNSRVACVDENGLITALEAGEAYITVTSLEGNYTASCKIKVYKEIEEISSLPLVISKGKVAACRVGASPYDHDEELIFSCDNEEIASVDAEGLVTAKAVGTATITVRGSISGVSHSFTVTVKEPVTAVEFEKERITVVKGVYSVVSYSILPSDADNVEKIEIVSSDETIARIEENNEDEGKLTIQALRTGEATITLTVTTNDGTFTDSMVVTITE